MYFTFSTVSYMFNSYKIDTDLTVVLIYLPSIYLSRQKMKIFTKIWNYSFYISSVHGIPISQWQTFLCSAAVLSIPVHICKHVHALCLVSMILHFLLNKRPHYCPAAGAGFSLQANQLLLNEALSGWLSSCSAIRSLKALSHFFSP